MCPYWNEGPNIDETKVRILKGNFSGLRVGPKSKISVLMRERKGRSEKQRNTEGHMKAEVETGVTLSQDINGRSHQKLE